MNETYYVANVRERDWSRVLNIGLAALLFGLFRALSNVYTGFDALVALRLPSTVYNMLPLSQDILSAR